MIATINQADEKTIVTIEGRLDTVNVHDFETQIAPIMSGETPDIVFDCADFDYISSSGLRTFLTVQKSVMERKGKLVIKNMKPGIKEVFNMTGFTSIFTIE